MLPQNLELFWLTLTNTESETGRLVFVVLLNLLVLSFGSFGDHIRYGGFNKHIGPDNWRVLMITVSAMRK